MVGRGCLGTPCCVLGGGGGERMCVCVCVCVCVRACVTCLQLAPLNWPPSDSAARTVTSVSNFFVLCLNAFAHPSEPY